MCELKKTDTIARKGEKGWGDWDVEGMGKENWAEGSKEIMERKKEDGGWRYERNDS